MKVKSSLILIGLVLFVFSCTGVFAQTSLPEEQGSLIDLVDKFRTNIIPRDSGKYVVATEVELKSFGSTFSLLLEWMNVGSGDKLSNAASNLADQKYILTKFTDTTAGRVFYLAREASDYNRGWGMYIFYAKGNGVYRNLLIEVPHIGFDLEAEKIGIRSFIQSSAGFFLLAGAHRDANSGSIADVAHTQTCVFQVVHKTLCTNTSTTIQIHGFAETAAGRQSYPQIILSSGAATGSQTLTTMSNQLTQNGFTVGIFDGTKYTDLGATENVQGIYTRSIGATFIHMEIARLVRDSSELRDKVAKSIESYATQSVIEVPEFSTSELMILAVIFVSWILVEAHKASNTRKRTLLRKQSE